MCSSSAAAVASRPTRELARRHRVTGVDISAVQIELARHHVPEASFVHADATELEIAPVSFDAVVALFVFGHVPIEEQAGLIARIGFWLRDGGYFLGTFGAGDPGEEITVDWLGAPMFFASLGGEGVSASPTGRRSGAGARRGRRAARARPRRHLLSLDPGSSGRLVAIRKVGVVGLGTMGAGIAQISVQSGFETVGREVSESSASAAARRSSDT